MRKETFESEVGEEKFVGDGDDGGCAANGIVVASLS